MRNKLLQSIGIISVAFFMQFIFSGTAFAVGGDLIWAQTNNPSSGFDVPQAIAVDATGIYVAGQSGISLDNQWRIEKRSFSTGAVLWTKTFNPGPYYDAVDGITVDATGIYVVGEDCASGWCQWRIEKRSLSTGAVIWAKTIDPGPNDDIAEDIAVDATGIYVSGSMYISGSHHVRIEKLSLSDGAVLWTQTSDLSSGNDFVQAITVDATGVYVAGCNSIPGDFQWHIEKRSLTTGEVIWTQTSNPSSGPDYANAIAVDATGIYFAARNSLLDNGQWHIEKRDLTTGEVIWTQTSNPSSGSDFAQAIAIDESGAYVAGVDSIPGNTQWRIEKVDLTTGEVIWTQTSNPSSGYDDLRAITVDATGIYVAGYDSILGNTQWRIEKRDLTTGAVTFPQTSNPSQGSDFAYAIAIDESGAYVAGVDSIPGNDQWRIEKVDLTTGEVIWTQTSNPSSGYDFVQAVTVDATGIYVAGQDSISGNTQWRVEKRDLTTGAVLWTQTNNPSSGFDFVQAITVDATGVYVAGVDSSTGDPQWRIEKRSLTTGEVIWTQTSNPSSGDDGVQAITVDATGIYVAGFDSLPGNDQWRIEKRSLTTGEVIWTQTSNPSSDYDYANAIAVDATGIYVAGVDSLLGDYQWHIEKHSLSTGEVIWTQTSNPSSDYDYANAIAVDATGIYVAGYDYALGNKQWRIETRNLSTGEVISTQTINPSVDDDVANAVAVDTSGIYVAGYDSILGNEQWRIEKLDKGICTGSSSVSWTDPTITANSTTIRKVHIDELRSAIDTRRIDAGLTNYSWTDPTITANSTTIRKVHIDELRTAITGVYSACGQVAPAWTDSTITANSTKIRKVHIDELRSAVSNAQ